jgi:hypothetical protein
VVFISASNSGTRNSLIGMIISVQQVSILNMTTMQGSSPKGKSICHLDLVYDLV